MAVCYEPDVERPKIYRPLKRYLHGLFSTLISFGITQLDGGQMLSQRKPQGFFAGCIGHKDLVVIRLRAKAMVFSRRAQLFLQPGHVLTGTELRIVLRQSEGIEPIALFNPVSALISCLRELLLDLHFFGELPGQPGPGCGPEPRPLACSSRIPYTPLLVSTRLGIKS